VVAVGLYLPQLRMDWPTIERRTLVAEELGFSSLWLMDHLAAPLAPQFDCFEGWTLATALAARTSTIRLGHLVLCDPFRHPVVLAKMAATLDVVSGGRLDLGLGWGSVADELTSYGITADGADDRAARLRESLDVISLMFAGEPFDYAGATVSVTGAVGRPVPAQSKVPIHIGGAGTRLTMPIVAEYADWWNCPSYAADRFDSLAPMRGSARISMQRPLGLASSGAVRDEVVATAQRRLGGWGGLIAGTPDEVVAGLRADVERGAELLIVTFSDFGTEDTLKLFAREVLPALETT
jgi:alkanesulfonate monooxygenase SsuD/methylene tetrahydromethanopterin reductase-like flavin-dependent oxidoreductase (luciferase family)